MQPVASALWLQAASTEIQVGWAAWLLHQIRTRVLTCAPASWCHLSQSQLSSAPTQWRYLGISSASIRKAGWAHICMAIMRATMADLDGSNWFFHVELLSHLRRRPMHEVLAAAVPQRLIINILLGFAHAQNPCCTITWWVTLFNWLDKKSDFVGLLMKLSVTTDIYT